MKHLARERTGPDSRATRQIHLFHTTIEPDQEVFERRARDARLAQVRLHIMVDARDALRTRERLRSAVPEWRNAGIWFCGAAGFGDATTSALAGHGFPAEPQSRQVLFSMTKVVRSVLLMCHSRTRSSLSDALARDKWGA